MFHAEFLKVRRSSVWIIAVVLPLMAVGTGALNVHNNAQQLSTTWSSLTSQVVLFYGMLFFSMGVSALTATLWRYEHRGTNWNLLLTHTRHSSGLVLAKIFTILSLVAVMQGVLVAGTWVAGVVLGVDGSFPESFLVACCLTVLLAFPLVALQSLLSMVFRSFSVPIGVGLAGCVAGIGVNYAAGLRAFSAWVPQGLVMRSLNMGSSAVAGMGDLSVSSVVDLAVPALVVSIVLVLFSVRWFGFCKRR